MATVKSEASWSLSRDAGEAWGHELRGVQHL
jgi:hypothetical protein